MRIPSLNQRDPRSPVGFPQQFEFVEGLQGKAERRKTRSWVTKQHYRKKRYESAKVKPADVSIDARVKHGKQSASCSNRSTIDTEDTCQSEGDHRSECEDVIRLNPGATVIFHVKRIGGGRADPFNSYPVPATRDVHQLVDHCETVISILARFIQTDASRLLCHSILGTSTLGPSCESTASLLGLVQPLPETRNSLPGNAPARGPPSCRIERDPPLPPSPRV